ncbi:hypothetical protein FRC02_006176 [Tulasnella sp. 418]|nr:hypothetical protein FRC02_006176 [Tulasnella sp. 418]
MVAKGKTAMARRMVLLLPMIVPLHITICPALSHHFLFRQFNNPLLYQTPNSLQSQHPHSCQYIKDPVPPRPPTPTTPQNGFYRPLLHIPKESWITIGGFKYPSHPSSAHGGPRLGPMQYYDHGFVKPKDDDGYAFVAYALSWVKK